MAFVMSEEEYEERYGDTLEHYGVPGMKWGKRKAVQASGLVSRQVARGTSNVKAIGGGLSRAGGAVKGRIQKLNTPRNRKIAGIATAAVVTAGVLAGAALLAKSGGNPTAALGSAKGIGKGLLDFAGTAAKGAGNAAANGAKLVKYTGQAGVAAAGKTKIARNLKDGAELNGVAARMAGRAVGNAARNAGRQVGAAAGRAANNLGNSASNARESASRRFDDVSRAAQIGAGRAGGAIRSTAKEYGAAARDSRRYIAEDARSAAGAIGNAARNVANSASNARETAGQAIANRVAPKAEDAYFGLKNAGQTSVSQIMSLASQVGGAISNPAQAAANAQQARARRND
jgi:hypothetical protein